MRTALFWGVCAAALALGLAFRLENLSVRPMHHDEANQAVRFGMLLESGEYRYDPRDHHGPTLYYLTLPFAWLRGQRSLAELDERTLRMVPAVFGAGLLLLFPLLARGIGRPAVASAAAVAAISPALTYYSRFYIQESIFVFFTVAFVIALGWYAVRPGLAPAISAGVTAGLAWATKETSLILVPAALVACGAAAVVGRGSRERPLANPGPWAAHVVAAAGAAIVAASFFYSGFGSNAAGLFSSLGAPAIYFRRGIDAGPHVHPWFYYLRMLAWSSSEGLVWTDALVLVLAAAGIAHAIAVRKTAFWPLYLAFYSIIATALFSAVPYKTPWNVLPSYAGLVLMAGIGTAALFARIHPRWARAVLAVVLLAAGWQLAVQSRRASFRYAADPRNPYAYAQTSPDFLRLASRVHDLAALDPDGRAMLVKVVAGAYEQWPLPWYVRDLTRVGYWPAAADAGPLDGVPVIVASQDNVPAVDAAVGERYVAEFYGLRPGVLLTLYVERGRWERFLASRQ